MSQPRPNRPTCHPLSLSRECSTGNHPAFFFQKRYITLTEYSLKVLRPLCSAENAFDSEYVLDRAAEVEKDRRSSSQCRLHLGDNGGAHERCGAKAH